METIIVLLCLILFVAFVAYLSMQKKPSAEPRRASSIRPVNPTSQRAQTGNLEDRHLKSASSDSTHNTPSNESGILDLLPHQFIVLDLETTGLNAASDEIIEFGAIRVHLDSDNHETFNTLVKPEKRIPRKITEITGITQQMVENDGLEIKVAMSQFISFIGDLPLVTYNAEFDMGFLYSATKKHGFVINNRYTCALKRARRAWPGLSSYRLDSLARMAKLSTDDTHRALGDCKRALIIFTSATSTLGQKVRWTNAPDDIDPVCKADPNKNEKIESSSEILTMDLSTEFSSEANNG